MKQIQFLFSDASMPLRLYLPLALLHLLVLTSCAPQSSSPAEPNTAAQFNGTWTNPSGEFKLWALDQQRLQVEFQGEYVYESPLGQMANVGAGEGMAVVEDQTATFRPEGAECTITLRRSGEDLEATEAGECGFGLNVTAEGTYRRVSRDQPQFGLP